MSETDLDTQQWREELEHHRHEKDHFFAEHPQSPIEDDAKADFDGLAYYDPDPDYRVEARLEPVDDDDTFEMEMTAGHPVEYVRVAELTFDLAGEERSLYAYEQAGDQSGETLFVPFRDETSGEATYGAGRYIELHPQDPDDLLVDGGEVPLDFNLAYSPFCAYNEAFACPIPPTENTLDVAVEAGEKLLD
jgi:uncharacterized protein (DUF1684 family)